jgi:hypothetical protein
MLKNNRGIRLTRILPTTANGTATAKAHQNMTTDGNTQDSRPLFYMAGVCFKTGRARFVAGFLARLLLRDSCGNSATDTRLMFLNSFFLFALVFCSLGTLPAQ